MYQLRKGGVDCFRVYDLLAKSDVSSNHPRLSCRLERMPSIFITVAHHQLMEMFSIPCLPPLQVYNFLAHFRWAGLLKTVAVCKMGHDEKRDSDFSKSTNCTHENVANLCFLQKNQFTILKYLQKWVTCNNVKFQPESELA